MSYLKLWTAKYGQPPLGRPNLYDMVGYGCTYVLAQAIRGCRPELQLGFSHQESWEKLKDAKPSDLGGFDVIFAESFSLNDHQGNKLVSPARIVNDKWTCRSVAPPARCSSEFADYWLSLAA